jgi:hypothetical protein
MRERDGDYEDSAAARSIPTLSDTKNEEEEGGRRRKGQRGASSPSSPLLIFV